MNKSYDEIIEDIKSDLTGNKDKDKQILLINMQKYAEHEYGREITRELGRLFYDYLTPEEIEEFEKALQKEIPERELLNQVSDDLNNQRMDDAFNKLDNYMKNNPDRYVNDKINEYHIFSNEMEEVLFNEYVHTDKEVRILPPDIPLVDLYYIYAFLLVEKNRLNDAEKYLKIALDYNPVSTHLIFELVDIYKRKGEWSNVFKYIKLAYKYAYLPEDLSRVYRDYGFYYTETHKPDVAVALYIYSLKYHDYPAAYQELEYLKHIGQNTDISKDEVEKILKENDIPLVANPFIVKEYRECGDRYGENDELEHALEMYTIAYMLDDSIENQLRYKMAKATLDGKNDVNISL